MGRSLAILVAMLVVFSGAAGLVTSMGTVSAASTVTMEIITPQNNEYVQESYVMLRWTATDPVYAIDRFYVYVDDPDYSDPLVTTQQEMNLTGLADGQHTVLVRAINEVGGSAEDAVLFNIDTSAPTLRITSPTSNSWLNTSDVTVTWQASSSVGISYFDVRIDSEPWVGPIPFDRLSNTFQNVTNGPHNVTVVAHGWGGRTSTAVVAFKVDTTVPTISITYPGDGAGFNHGDITVVWTGSDAGNNLAGYQIWVDGTKVTTAIPSENHYNANFADGYHTVRIVAYDIANSTASDEATFLIDTMRPSIVSKGPSGVQEQIGTSVQVEFSKAMSVEATELSIDGVTGTMSWDGNTLTFTPSAPLAYGTTYRVTLDAADLVGNTINESWSFATTDMGLITGVVTDKDGKPLAGVKVSLENGEHVMTNEAGEFTVTARAGQHNLTLSKLGWDGTTVTVSLQPGQTISLGSVSVTPTNPLALYGVLAAVGAVTIVGVLYYYGRRGKKVKRPQYRSMRGMENLQKRAARKGRNDLDEDDDEYL